MRRLSILGAGGHGKVVADAAENCGRWDEIIFYDDIWPAQTQSGPWRIAGSVRDFMEGPAENSDVVVAFGDNALRVQFAERLRNAGFRLVSIIHPAAVVSAHATIDLGTVVFAGAVINIGAEIGTACIINTRAVIEHDCVLGKAVHVSPGANLAGLVTIGNESWVGIGACIRQQIKVGRNVTIGAGAVVVAPLPDDVTVVGNPARPLRKR